VACPLKKRTKWHVPMKFTNREKDLSTYTMALIVETVKQMLQLGSDDLQLMFGFHTQYSAGRGQRNLPVASL